MHLRGDAFTFEEKKRNFAYYEAITVRDSSLSAATQAVIAAEVGHLELAHDYLGETALVDLHNLADNTGDGLHIAALAGGWTALVAGFGGMRARDGHLNFAPGLPSGISRLAFRLRYRGRRLAVTVTADAATYELLEGPALQVTHYEEQVELADKPVELPILMRSSDQPPKQPPGCAPKRRASLRAI